MTAPLAIDSSADTPVKPTTRLQNLRSFLSGVQTDCSMSGHTRLRRGGKVYVACDLGHLPYSAENREGRRNRLMILSAAGAAISARLLLTDFHKISLLANVTVPDVQDSKAIVSGAAASVIGMLPMIDLMETCVVPTADRPDSNRTARQFTFGSTKTCPG